MSLRFDAPERLRTIARAAITKRRVNVLVKEIVRLNFRQTIKPDVAEGRMTAMDLPTPIRFNAPRHCKPCANRR